MLPALDPLVGIIAWLILTYSVLSFWLLSWPLLLIDCPSAILSFSYMGQFPPMRVFYCWRSFHPFILLDLFLALGLLPVFVLSLFNWMTFYLHISINHWGEVKLESSIVQGCLAAKTNSKFETKPSLLKVCLEFCIRRKLRSRGEAEFLPTHQLRSVWD